MEPIKPPKTLKIYQLVRQSGMTFSNSATSTIHNLGSGFFLSQQEAEHHRTLEVLKEIGGSKNYWHIFELEVPNPIYQE